MTIHLDTLRKTAEAATPGPWIAHELGGEPGYWWVWQESKLPYYGGVAEVAGRDPGTICYPEISGGHSDGEQDRIDAEFIATFNPETVLALLSRLEQAEQQVARVREVIRQYDPDCLTCMCNSDGDCCKCTVADFQETLDGDGRG